MGAGVFVSYRKDDDPGWAGRVRDSLAHHFGDDNVFFDVDSIRAGQRWEEAIDAALTQSQSVVLVIGPSWLSCLNERAGTSQTDYHLREIVMALDRGIHVYPVRVRQAPMPDLSELPDELSSRLPAIQWMEVYENLFTASMKRIIDDIEHSMTTSTSKTGLAKPAEASATSVAEARPNGASLERQLSHTTVGPPDADAAFSEIADAVAGVESGGVISVLPGRYRKPVSLDRSVQILCDDGVVLEPPIGPCVRSCADGVVIRNLNVTVPPMAGAEGIVVENGEMTLESIGVTSSQATSSTGIAARGSGSTLHMTEVRVTGTAVGIRYTDGARGRAELVTVNDATVHALEVRSGADPQLLDSTFTSSGASGVLVADGGLGTLDRCVFNDGDRLAIEITTDGEPTIRGTRERPKAVEHRAISAARSLKEAVTERNEERPAGSSVVVSEGGRGTLTNLALGRIDVTTGAEPTVTECSIQRVVGDAEGRGTFEHCDIGQVELSRGANPTFQSACQIHPNRGVKVSVEIRDGASGTFEDCIISGRNVVDGSPDPAVLITSKSNSTLRRCTVSNPGEGAVWVTDGATARIEGGALRSTMSGAALVVEGGTVEASDLRARGVSIRSKGTATVSSSEISGDALSGVVIDVTDGGSLDVSGSKLVGAQSGVAGKVGGLVRAAGSRVKRNKAGAATIRFAVGTRGSFTWCQLSGMTPDSVHVPDMGVTFEGCSLDE